MLSTAAKVRIARMLYLVLRFVRTPFGGRNEVRTKRRGVHWVLDLREGIDLTIYTLGAFEIDTLLALQKLVRPGDTVLDIGANIGAHTLHLARLVGDSGRVIAFEPTDFAINKLRTNLRANPSLEPRVVVHQGFLVADSAATLVPAIASSWPVDGTVPDDLLMASRAMGSSGASAMSLDSVMAAAGEPDVRLIKMDVDGHELEVLEGARGLLRSRHPIIVMELAPYVFHPPEKFDAMVNLLTEYGYVFEPLGSSRRLPSDLPQLRASIPRNGSVNVVARPGDNRVS